MKIIITGVAGLLGCQFSDWLLKNTNHEIVGIDDLSGGYLDNVNSKIKFYKFDLAEKTNVDKVFKKEKPDIVYHFAAYAAEGLSPFIRTYNYKNNLISTTKIINSCINYNIKRLVFTSSMAVYGEGWHNKRPFSEEHTPSPIDPYGVAKMACEIDIQIAGVQHGLDWCIIRPHNVYGEKQNIWDKYRNVLGIWMWQYLNNQPMTIFGDGKQKRSFSYIGDAMEPLYKAGFKEEASKEIINLGGSKFHTINEANKILLDVIGQGEIIYKEPRHEVKDAYPTWEKSVKILGFQDKTDLKEGLSKMWVWAKNEPKRERKSWESYEVEKGIYDFWKTPRK